MSQYNEQFATATRQFADTNAQISRLSLESAEETFGLQLATLEENVYATFAFLGEVAQVRDFDGLKSVWPKGVQVARENIERTVSTGQEVFGRVVKANEAIGQVAKSQFETVAANANAEVEKVAQKVAPKKATSRR